MKKYNLLVLLLTLLLSLNVNACVVPPKGVYQDIQETVSKSKNVLLLEIRELSFTESGYSYTGEIKEVLKGTKIVSDTYIIKFDNPYYEYSSLLEYSFDKEFNEDDYDFHSDPRFDDLESGRVGINPSCRVEAIFKIGETYLVMDAKPYTTKSFELIKDRLKDKHYMSVKEYLRR